MKTRTCILPAILLCSTFSLLADNLLYNIIDGQYAARELPETVSCTDGEHYLQLQQNKYIVKYAYRTGQPVDTLFNAENTQLHKLETIDGFVTDPAEKRLLVYNNTQQIYRHSFRADYYLFDIQRNELKALSDTMPVQEPLFSPNGRYIAFGRDNNLYIHKVDYGTEVAVTTDGKAGCIINGTTDWLYEEEFAVTRLYCWSPDSKQLAFVRFDETEVPVFTFQSFLKDDFQSPLLYPENNRLKYPKAGEPNAKVSARVYDVYYKSIKTMQINPDNQDIYIPRIRWTQNPEQLAVFTLNRNQTELQMWLANPKSTVCKLNYSEQSDVYIDFRQIDEFQFLSDGRFIAVNETDGYRHAYMYSANGLEEKQLIQGNFDVTHVYGYDETSRKLYYQSAAMSPLQRNIYVADTKKDKITCLTPEKGTHKAEFSNGFRYFTDHYSSLQTADRYDIKDATGKNLCTLLDNDDVQASFSQLGLPEKQFFTFRTSDNVELNGWMLKPAAFDAGKKYPVLQVQYSGPNSQMVLDRWDIDWEYYLATQGYIIVCVDGRGTGARGRDFRTAAYMQLGEIEAHDQIETAKYLGTLPFVDKNRIGIWGWSYGGFMTLVCMSQDEQTFKAGISVAPVTDYKLYDSAYTERYMRRPQENFRGYEQISLPAKADKLKGNLLIVHGTGDDNVHAQNTMLYVHSLIEANKQFEMQIYPDDNHFLKKGNSYRHLYTRMVNFLQKNL